MRPALDRLYEKLDPLHVDPGWRVTDISIRKEPEKSLLPALWKWREGRSALHEVARIVSPEMAERRNLIMRNPAEGHAYGTLRTMIAAYQLMLPGERARTHRHTPHALRVILEGEGSFTVVDGVRVDMRPGDVVLTPGGCWHGHGVEGGEPCIWLDVLDRPLNILLEPVFQDYHPNDFEAVIEVATETPLLFPWSETRARLDNTDPDAEGRFGPRILLDTPDLKTLALHMQLLPEGLETKSYRSSANYIYCVLQGEGRSVIDGRRFDWSFGDVFAVPCWRPLEHVAASDAVLFSASDEPVQRFCGYFREDRAGDRQRGTS